MIAKILIVDDEPNVRLMYRSSLETEGYEIFEAESGQKALSQCVGRKFDVAIFDLRMPGIDGLELLCRMHDLNIHTPVVFITAFADVPNAVNAMKLGAIDFLKKPILPEQLRSIVKDVLIRHEPEETRQHGPHDFDYHLRCAKRAINLRDFNAARRHLVRALELNDKSPQAFNLVGVMLEMREEYEQAKRYYGQAIKLDKNFEPAQQNMRRLFELFHFGASSEPVNTDSK